MLYFFNKILIIENSESADDKSVETKTQKTKQKKGKISCVDLWIQYNQK